MKHEIAFRGEFERAAAIWKQHPAAKTKGARNLLKKASKSEF